MLSQGKKGAPTRLLCPEEALCVCLRVRACRVHACLWGRVSVSVLARLHMAVCTRVCPWACSGAALLRAHARLGTGCGSGWLFVSPPFSPRPAALETPPLTPPPTSPPSAPPHKRPWLGPGEGLVLPLKIAAWFSSLLLQIPHKARGSQEHNTSGGLRAFWWGAYQGMPGDACGSNPVRRGPEA